MKRAISVCHCRIATVGSTTSVPHRTISAGGVLLEEEEVEEAERGAAVWRASEAAHSRSWAKSDMSGRFCSIKEMAWIVLPAKKPFSKCETCIKVISQTTAAQLTHSHLVGENTAVSVVLLLMRHPTKAFLLIRKEGHEQVCRWLQGLFPRFSHKLVWIQRQCIFVNFACTFGKPFLNCCLTLGVKLAVAIQLLNRQNPLVKYSTIKMLPACVQTPLAINDNSNTNVFVLNLAVAFLALSATRLRDFNNVSGWYLFFRKLRNFLLQQAAHHWTISYCLIFVSCVVFGQRMTETRRVPRK